MIRRQIVRAGWATMVLLVLTSCGMMIESIHIPRMKASHNSRNRRAASLKNMRPREQNRAYPGNR